MISPEEVRRIFVENLPAGVVVRFIPHREYVDRSLESPFIKRQVEVGIYDLDNIYDDFLSPACSYVQSRMVDVCYELLATHAEGVDDDSLTRAYITSIARHEAHHFHQNHLTPETWQDHVRSEVECIDDAYDPENERYVELFQERSAVYRRVLGRLDDLKKVTTSGDTNG